MRANNRRKEPERKPLSHQLIKCCTRCADKLEHHYHVGNGELWGHDRCPLCMQYGVIQIYTLIPIKSRRRVTGSGYAWEGKRRGGGGGERARAGRNDD